MYRESVPLPTAVGPARTTGRGREVTARTYRDPGARPSPDRGVGDGPQDRRRSGLLRGEALDERRRLVRAESADPARVGDHRRQDAHSMKTREAPGDCSLEII